MNLSVALTRQPAERRLNPAGVGGYLQLNIQILYIFCFWSGRGGLPRHSWCTPLSNAPPERSPAARLRRPAERRLNPAGVGGYLQLNVQILYIFCF